MGSSNHKQGHLVCIGGLPGVGKSTVTHKLCAHFKGSMSICPDITRLKVMGKDVNQDVVVNDDLQPAITVDTISSMKQQSEDNLKDGKLVVIGSAFIGEKMRLEYAKMAADLGCGFDGIWLEADEDIRSMRAVQRLSEHQQRKDQGLDRGFNASAVVVDVTSCRKPEGNVTWDRVDARGCKDEVFSVVLGKLNHLNRLV